MFIFSYNSQYEISFHRNWITGKTIINESRYSFTAPWVQVVKIDTMPVKVCIECDCNNMTCELVSFDRGGWQDFLATEGFRYYWLSNRLSFNYGHKHEYRGMSDILRGYAFSDKHYSFIKVSKKI